MLATGAVLLSVMLERKSTTAHALCWDESAGIMQIEDLLMQVQQQSCERWAEDSDSADVLVSLARLSIFLPRGDPELKTQLKYF